MSSSIVETVEMLEREFGADRIMNDPVICHAVFCIRQGADVVQTLINLVKCLANQRDRTLEAYMDFVQRTPRPAFIEMLKDSKYAEHLEKALVKHCGQAGDD